ncbi:TraK family protein [Pseudomonas asiatica]|uniref:TraK family protein n=1 Tax=Pseudomonas asiatica TaxID=2219225 RepID=UPI0010C0EC9F|nr:TraK family protein [Pseudomonas asiatica]MEE1901735.1 TraK family protein [Pseudomonas inefficax]MEE1906949.1 TraK family protein [Pseudomonas inefficax]MEE1984621.1 TraK family protein [Pseudomonas inefficax]
MTNEGLFVVLGDTDEAIQRGHSLLSIWTVLRDEGVVDFGYQAFSRHVRNGLHLPDRFASAGNQPLSNH